jgi:hypothetical protein
LTYSSLGGNLVVLGRLVIKTRLPGSSGSSGTSSGGLGRANLAAFLTLDEGLRTAVELANGARGPRLKTMLGLKLLQGLGRQSSGTVVDAAGMVNLVDRHSGVDNLRSDSLLLNHRLDVLVEVVVNMLALNGGSDGLRVLSIVNHGAVAVLGSISIEGSLGLFGLIMLESLVLDSSSVVNVLLSAEK